MIMIKFTCNPFSSYFFNHAKSIRAFWGNTITIAHISKINISHKTIAIILGICRHKRSYSCTENSACIIQSAKRYIPNVKLPISHFK